MVSMPAVLVLAWVCDVPPALPMAAGPRRESAAAASVDRPLDLGDLEQIAARNNPTLGQAVDRFEQARGRAMQAGVYPNPLVAWSGSNLGAQGTAGTQLGFIQQPIITAHKLKVNRSRYEIDVEIARWNCVEQQLRVRTGVRMRYLQVLAQQHVVDARNGLARMAGDVVATTRRKVASGHAAEPDALLAEGEAEQSGISLDQSHDRLANTWREMAAFLGCPDLPLARLSGTLEGDVSDRSWEATLGHLLAESPEMKVAELQVHRQQLTLKRERIEPIPDLIVRGGGGYNPTNNQSFGYAQVYVEVPIWDRNRGNIHTAERGLAEIERDKVRIRLNLQQRLTRPYNHHQASLAEVRRLGGVVLPRSRKAFDLYLDRFDAEKNPYSDVHSSQTFYADALTMYFEELLELRRAEAAIDGLLLFEESIEVGSFRPPSSSRLSPPGQGLPRQTAGGGVPVGRPSRDEQP